MIKSSEAYREAITADARRIYVKAVVDIEDPDMVKGEASGSEQEPDLSRPGQLWDKIFSLNANYVSLEPNRWLLNGSTVLRPSDAGTRDWEAGYVGALLSGEDGAFAVPQTVQVEFSNVGVLQACTVAFPDTSQDGYAADFTVEVVSEGVAYYTKTVTGNTKPLYPVTGFRVNRPDCIRLTVTRWSLPGRRMRVVEIVPGIYEVWGGDELADFKVKQQGDPSCLTLPYGTATVKMDNQSRRFDPRSKDGLFLMIEDRQGIELSMGPLLPDGTIDYKPLGTFFQANGGWTTGDNSVTMQWDLVDIIGLLAQRKFFPGDGPLPTTLRGWLEAVAGQLGINFTRRVKVDPEYGNLLVSFHLIKQEGQDITEKDALAAMTCGDILRYVCMATRTWPKADASTGYLAADALRADGNSLTLDNLNKYPTIMANDDAASVTVNGYTTEGNAPASGNTVEITNPFVSNGGEVAAARSLLSYYGGNRMQTVGRGDPASEIGDMDVIWLAEGNATSARRVRQELSLSKGVLKNCTSNFIRGDGLFQFTGRQVFLEGGTFTVPDGVWQLRVVLVSHGEDGKNGTGGKWANTTNLVYTGQGSEIKYPVPNGGNGYDGANGTGGKVWQGVFDVNPGQVIDVTVGTEAALWHYSSANGTVYPNGFTDAATGDIYGRSGVSDPQPGSGDGGVGGKGGKAGKWYETAHWYYDDGHIAPPGSGGWVGGGVDVNYDAPGHYETETVYEREPTPGTPGTPGATGSAIIYWEVPEVIEE